ncbi:PTS sugar transporter subunit IIB, partial [Enterobacter hormaechei]|uniref:PTS sugar transporter subunit IIB n=1 Tax=Enterobacter hormaechei TaxID=158836 RepID=UPI00123A03BD
RWAREVPCDGIVAIDDAVAADPLLSSVMKGAVSDTKVWLCDTATAIEKLPKVIASEKRYFVIGKSPLTLQRIEQAGFSLKNSNG